MFARKNRPGTIRRHANPHSLRLESLENRQLLATVTESSSSLWIEGTAAHDQVEVRIEGSQMVVDAFDGTNRVAWRGAPKPIFFMGKDGDDRFVNNTNQTAFAYGHAGNDTLVGGSAIDRLVGGTGNDVVNGNGGNDWLYGDTTPGGDGYSDYYENPRAQAGDDQIFGGEGLNSIYGGPGQDLLYGGNQTDWINGDAGHDTIFGLGGDDWLSGGDGNDTIRGGYGNDRLLGNDGADFLFGEYGNDYLDGGFDRDRDTLVGDYESWGGSGRDTYVQHYVQEREYLDNRWYIRGDSWYEDAIVDFNALAGDQIETQVHYVSFLLSKSPFTVISSSPYKSTSLQIVPS